MPADQWCPLHAQFLSIRTLGICAMTCCAGHYGRLWMGIPQPINKLSTDGAPRLDTLCHVGLDEAHVPADQRIFHGASACWLTDNTRGKDNARWLGIQRLSYNAQQMTIKKPHG